MTDESSQELGRTFLGGAIILRGLDAQRPRYARLGVVICRCGPPPPALRFGGGTPASPKDSGLLRRRKPDVACLGRNPLLALGDIGHWTSDIGL